MKIEVKEYTYETMPDYTDEVEGAKEIKLSGKEIHTAYIPDVVYDRKDGTDLHLQIVTPKCPDSSDGRFPCVVYVQGSAWKEQDVHSNVANIGLLARKGYVTAIVQYRHSGIAKFPAQIIDAKNAIRFLIEHKDEYGVDENNIIIAGNSSGGHTSAMVGMTAKTDLFDEPINSRPLNIKGIIDLYGAVDITMDCGFPTTLNHGKPDSPEGMLMGFDISENPEAAKAACAKTYAGLDYAPMLIVHGTKDKTVFAQESVDLYNEIKAREKDVQLYLIRGADHGGAAFWSDEMIEIYHNFIQKCIK